MRLTLMAEPHAVWRLEPGSPVPLVARRAGQLTAIVSTDEEVCVVGPEFAAPESGPAEHGFRVVKVEGPLDFALVGVLASLTATLAEASVPVFVISTFDTDYILIRASNLAGAIGALRAAGHTIAARGE